MVCQDGFITSHAVEGIDIFPDEKIKKFVGEYTIKHSLLDTDNPVTYGPLDLQDFYFEHKRQEAEAMEGALRIIPEVLAEFNKALIPGFWVRHTGGCLGVGVTWDGEDVLGGLVLGWGVKF